MKVNLCFLKPVNPWKGLNLNEAISGVLGNMGKRVFISGE